MGLSVKLLKKTTNNNIVFTICKKVYCYHFSLGIAMQMQSFGLEEISSMFFTNHLKLIKDTVNLSKSKLMIKNIFIIID